MYHEQLDVINAFLHMSDGKLQNLKNEIKFDLVTQLSDSLDSVAKMVNLKAFWAYSTVCVITVMKGHNADKSQKNSLLIIIKTV